MGNITPLFGHPTPSWEIYVDDSNCSYNHYNRNNYFHISLSICKSKQEVNIGLKIYQNLNQYLSRERKSVGIRFNTYTEYIFLGCRNSDFIDEEC